MMKDLDELLDLVGSSDSTFWRVVLKANKVSDHKSQQSFKVCFLVKNDCKINEINFVKLSFNQSPFSVTWMYPFK
jgi:hypothetical protein